MKEHDELAEEKWTEDELEIIEASHYDEGVFEAAQECSVEFENVDEAYNGHFRNDEEFTQQLLEDTGYVPSDMPWYVVIDWEATAKHIMMDYCEDNNHYFRCL